MEEKKFGTTEDSNFIINVYDQSLTILDQKYVILKTLGKGKTAKVKLAYHIHSKKHYAIKILNQSNPNDSNFNNEVESLLSLKNENIILGYEFSPHGLLIKPDSSRKVCYLVLEYADKGDLFDYIFYPRKRFGEKYGLYIFKEIINALEYTHRKNIVHRDVKTENIMIGSDWKIKLTDYGFAKINKYNLLSTFVGTKSYAPPEILSHNKYLGLPCDVFSCGATLFLIVTGQKPFGQIGCASEFDPFYKNILFSDYEKFWKMHIDKGVVISEEFKSLINSMLAYDPAQRPTITEIKNHPWFIQSSVSREEMIEEYTRRQEIIFLKKELEENKRFENVLTNANIAESLNVNSKTVRVYRPGLYKGDETVLIEENKIKLNFENSYLEEYVESFNPYKVKFKKICPEKLYQLVFNLIISISNGVIYHIIN